MVAFAPMALTATMYHWQIGLSDVDRGVYESLDLRLARHPSESLRYLITRAFAYALSYEEGIAFSKAGIASTDEPPVSVRDATGILTAWIDVGAPAADRLHKATKAARRVAIFSHVELAALRREAATRAIHKVEQIEVYCLAGALLDAIEARIDRNLALEVVRSDGHLYVTVGGTSVDAPLPLASLVAEA